MFTKGSSKIGVDSFFSVLDGKLCCLILLIFYPSILWVEVEVEGKDVRNSCRREGLSRGVLMIGEMDIFIFLV